MSVVGEEGGEGGRSESGKWGVRDGSSGGKGGMWGGR